MKGVRCSPTAFCEARTYSTCRALQFRLEPSANICGESYSVERKDVVTYNLQSICTALTFTCERISDHNSWHLAYQAIWHFKGGVRMHCAGGTLCYASSAMWCSRNNSARRIEDRHLLCLTASCSKELTWSGASTGWFDRSVEFTLEGESEMRAYLDK